MTDEKSSKPIRKILGGTGAPFHIEMYKGQRGSILAVGDIISIVEYGSDTVELLARGGRMRIIGEGITVSLFENRTVELYGRIKGIELAYGKEKLIK